MGTETKAFAPLYQPSSETAGVATAGTLQPSVTVVAGVAAVASTVFPGTTQNNFTQIQIANKTSVWAHVNFGVLLGGLTVTAATLASSYPVAPGSVIVVTVAPEVNAASVITDGAPAGSTSVIFTRGGGI